MRKLLLLALTVVTLGSLSGCTVYTPGPRYGYHHYHRGYWR